MAEPSRVYDDNPGGQPVTRPDLRALEGGGTGSGGSQTGSPLNQPGGGGTTGSGGNTVSSSLLNMAESAGAGATLGKGFNPNDSISGGLNRIVTFFGSKTGKRTLAGGGVAGIVIGGGLGLMSVFSGPFQFIHIAQLLSQFHLSAQQDATDHRFSKIVQRIREPGKSEKTRLGYLGNHYADTFEGRMKTAGFEPTYSKGARFGTGYDINRESDTFKGKSSTDITNELTEKYGIPPDKIKISSSGGGETIHINTDGSYRSTLRMNRAILNKAGYSKVVGSAAARIMGKRAGVTWHPMKKIDAKLREKTFAFIKERWAKSRNTQIKTGRETYSLSLADNTPKDKDGKPTDPVKQSEADKAKGSTQATKTEGETIGAQSSDGNTKAVSEYAKGMTVKLAGGGLAAVGALCMAQGIAQNYESLKYEQVILPMMRMGMEAVSLGNQAMEGTDADMQQLEFYSDLLTKKDDNGKVISTWDEAKSIQAEEGVAQTGIDIPTEAKVNGQKQEVIGSLSSLSWLKSICNAVNSEAGTLVSLVFSGGPIGAAFGIATMPAFNAFSSWAAHWLAGAPVDPDSAGADYGNIINYGVRLAANDQAVAAGGNVLSDSQVAALDSISRDATNAQFQSENIASRLFNPYDSRTLVARIMNNSAITGGLSGLTHSFVTMGSSLVNLPGTLVMNNTASAATTTPYNYGFPKYGFSESDLDSPSVSDPYANAQEAARLLDIPCDSGHTHVCGDDYRAWAKQCFNANIIKGDQGWDVIGTNAGGINLYDGSYSKNTQCTSHKDDWMHIRFFIFDTETMESAACYEGDEQSCTNIGFNNGQGSGEGTAAAPGTGQIPSSTGYQWPMSSSTISSLTITNCWRSSSNGSGHTGIDIPVRSGTPVLAANAGTVVQTGGPGGDGGNYIIIQHSDGHWTNYQHLSSIGVSEGQTVTAGQQIGRSGNTGNSTGAHLHFGVTTSKTLSSRFNTANSVNPLPFLPSSGGPKVSCSP